VREDLGQVQEPLQLPRQRRCLAPLRDRQVDEEAEASRKRTRGRERERAATETACIPPHTARRVRYDGFGGWSIQGDHAEKRLEKRRQPFPEEYRRQRPATKPDRHAAMRLP
jgi:hypothetical protein